MESRLADPAYYSMAFVLALILSIVMLWTDQNLQTDFGSISSGYYVHWYGVLATAIVDLVGVFLLIFLRTRLMFKLGVIVSGLFSLMFLLTVFTYGQVGFTSAGDFANYLFGVTYYGGDIRYLYDALLATYVLTFLYGLLALRMTRQVPHPPATPVSPAP